MCTEIAELNDLADRLIHNIAGQLARMTLFRGEDPDDLEGEMWVIATRRLRNYRPERGSMTRYVGIVAGSAKRTLIRRRLTRQRQFERRLQSLHDLVEFDGDVVERHETLVNDRAERQRLARQVISDAMDGATEDEWEAFHALEFGSLRKAAQHLDFDRSCLSKRVTAIRARFTASDDTAPRNGAATLNGHRVVNE